MSTASRARKAFTYPQATNALRAVFEADSRPARIALAWLADTCHATTTVARDTESETNRAIGRREVWLLLNDMLRMDEADIRDLQEQVSQWGES